jgi:tRNA (guanine-N7-)-methyltransferase
MIAGTALMEQWSYALDNATVLRPGIRTFKPRRSRITPREQWALDHHDGLLITPGASHLDFAELFSTSTPPVLEIGFGIGDSTVAYAKDQPDVPILAIDVHTPGVGRLIADLQEKHITNVRVVEADALSVLVSNVPDHSLSGVRSFFPDPWPKARHFKRRLIQPAVLELVARKLAPQGWWHIATDWPEYAEWIANTFSENSAFTGGAIVRPHDRPITHFERRGINEGRPIVDFRYVISTP